MKLFSPPAALSFDELFEGIEHMLAVSPCLRNLSRGGLRAHLKWYWDHGTVSWAKEPEEGKYTGICLIKLMSSLEDMDSWYVHDPDGQYLFIEEVVSDGPVTWRKLFDQLYYTWGKRDFIIWDRRERTEKSCPRIYTWKQYYTILRRLTREREMEVA